MEMEKYFMSELLSSSESSSDEELLVRGPTYLRPRVLDYVEKVVDEYNDTEFKTHFRISRRTFAQVLALINNDISTNESDIGHHTILAKTQLLLAIWYFATPDSYRSICSRFNVGKATGLRCVRRVTNALCAKSSTFIKWPTEAESTIVVDGFEENGFPGVIGAIDGTHISIPKPKNHGLSYINRHNQFSIILQAVCDHKMKFIHCYAGEVGSSHDSRVLKNSEIWTKLTQHPETSFPNNTHLIGDKAYPCLPHLQVPYKDNGHLTEAQRNFNFQLSSARSVIERAFALLKGRFRCLKFFELKNEEWMSKYIIACCVLHNICITNEDFLEIEQLPQDEPQEADYNNLVEREVLQLGQLKRNTICQQLFRNHN